MLLTAIRVVQWKALCTLASILALVLTSFGAPLAALAAPQQQVAGPGPTIYVPNDGFATVSFRDASSFDIRATATLTTPNTSAINHSPDGSLLFLTNQGFTHRLDIVDVATQNVLAGVDLPFRGLSNCNASSVLPVNGNTKIYVACEGNGFVEVAHFDPQTHELTLGTPFYTGWPKSLQQVGGYVFVADTQFNKLKRIDPQTDELEDVIPHQSYIFGDAVVDPLRPYAYIVNQFGQRLLIANTFTHAISRTMEFDGELMDLQLAPDGDHLYVTVDGGNSDDYIAVVDGLGVAESVAVTVPVGPAANYLSINDEGTCLYTWDFVGGARRIDVIDTTHNQLSAQPIIAGGGADGDFVGPGASTQAIYLEPNNDNQNSFVVGEGTGSIQVAVRRSCSAQGTVQVSYATQNGSGGDPAVAGQDYEATSGVLEFADGEVVKIIEIPLIDNDLYGQPSRFFDLILSNPSGAILGLRAVATIRIDDDDPIPTGSDLQLYLSADPEPVVAGNELTYYLNVYNYPTNGGAEANDVVLANVLPAGVAFISVETTNDPGGGGGGGESLAAIIAGSGAAGARGAADLPGEIPQPGSCNTPAVGQSGTVICNLGVLNPAHDGASASMTIRVSVPPEAANSDLSDAASVSTSSFDPFLDNNSANVSTHVEAPAVNLPATITIVKDAQPNAARRFRYLGALGNFRLRDEGSNTENARTFTVSAGVYTVTERVPGGWFLTAINCTPGANAAVDLAASQVALTVTGGANVTCTFVNQKAATIRAFLFQDSNRNGTRQGREPVNEGWTVNLLNDQNQQVASAVTNRQGKVSFTNVRPGVYTVCEILQNGLTNSQPCAAIQANPGQTTVVTFANRTAGAVRSAGADQFVSQFASPEDEDPDADEAIMPSDDAWLNSEAPFVLDESELAARLYLPVVTR